MIYMRVNINKLTRTNVSAVLFSAQLVLVSPPLQEFDAFRGFRNAGPRLREGCVSYSVLVLGNPSLGAIPLVTRCAVRTGNATHFGDDNNETEIRLRT